MTGPPPRGRVHWSVGRVSPAAAQPGSVGPVGPDLTEVVALILGRTLSSRYSSVSMVSTVGRHIAPTVPLARTRVPRNGVCPSIRDSPLHYTINQTQYLEW